MSWIDKVKTDLTVVCGDGKSYSPYWMSANKTIEYNFSAFEFKGVAGTLVRRGFPRGTQYGLRLVFQGENHLDTCEAFLASAADRRPWNISHPFYGNILVQPTGLSLDNSEMNVSAINGTIIETMSVNEAARSNVSPVDKIYEGKMNTDALLNQSFATAIPSINAVDTVSMSANIGNIFGSVSQKIKDSNWKDQYLNAMNKATAALNNPVFDTITTIQAVRDFTTMPYQFSDSLRDRINMFVTQFNLLNSTVANLFTRTSKKIYEQNAGVTISGMMLSAVTGIADAYENSVDTLSIIDLLMGSYNQFIENMDLLQSQNGGSPDSYIPDAASITELSNLVSLTINTLLDIAAGGKQQRIAYLAEDSCIIQVAHELYTYTGDDSIFDKLIAQNNISMRELLILPKGRKIIYYI